MNILIILLVLIEVVLNVTAQILLKVGMTRIGQFAFHGINIAPIAFQVLTSPFIMFGVSVYVISLIIWLLVLSRIDVSLAYPLISLGFVLNAGIAYFLLGEHITLMRLIGTIVIMFGIFLVARS